MWLSHSDAEEWDGFGTSVSIWREHAVVGVPRDDERGGYAGLAFIFRREGTNWVMDVPARFYLISR